MIDRTLSFAHGKGDLDHNSRRKNGNDRTRGIRERRVWNETLVELDVDDVLEREYGAALITYNGRQIAGRHPERCKTISGWVHAQRHGGRPYTEYVIQLGNRLTGCPYEFVTDANGNMLDEKGSIIMPWQTRKTPAPLVRDDGLHVSAEYGRLKAVYRDVFKKWNDWNPDMVVVGAYIHADERGGVHMHIDCICKSKAKNGIGMGIGVTGCLKQMLDRKGIKYGTTREDNAQKKWTKLMRKRLTELAMQHGYNIIDGHCKGKKHKSTPEFINEENIRNDYLDKQHEEQLQKEAELNAWQQELQKEAEEQDAREDYIRERESVVREKELAIKEKGNLLRGREVRLSARESRIQSSLAVAQADRNAAALMLEEVQQKNSKLDKREAALQKQIASIQNLLDMVKKHHPEWLRGVEYELKQRNNSNNNEI